MVLHCGMTSCVSLAIVYSSDSFISLTPNLGMHEQQPFHVMIGGGDQIYNDSVRVDGPLREWTAIANPHKRRNFPFTEDFRKRNDE